MRIPICVIVNFSSELIETKKKKSYVFSSIERKELSNDNFTSGEYTSGIMSK